MKIKINSLSAGFHDFVLLQNVEKYGLNEPFIGEVDLKVTADKSETQIVFNCEFNVTANLICDRCLDEYKSELADSFKIIYLTNSFEDVSDTDNLYVLKPEQSEVDLTQDFFDYMKLALPQKNLCSDDCKGLCSTCGVNLNHEQCSCNKEKVNPIWEDLLKINFDDNKKK